MKIVTDFDNAMFTLLMAAILFFNCSEPSTLCMVFQDDMRTCVELASSPEAHPGTRDACSEEGAAG